MLRVVMTNPSVRDLGALAGTAARQTPAISTDAAIRTTERVLQLAIDLNR